MRRLDYKNRARRVAHDLFGGRAKEYAPQSCPTVRCDHYQINLALAGNANYLCRSIAMRYDLFDIQPGALIAFGYLRQLARGGIFQLLAYVSNRQRLCYPSVAYGRDDRLYHVHADD